MAQPLASHRPENSWRNAQRQTLVDRKALARRPTDDMQGPSAFSSCLHSRWARSALLTLVAAIALFTLYGASLHDGVSLRLLRLPAPPTLRSDGRLQGDAYPPPAGNASTPSGSDSDLRFYAPVITDGEISIVASVESTVAHGSTPLAALDAEVKTSRPILYIRFAPAVAGLSNKMFQYASSRGLALRHGCDARLVVESNLVAAKLEIIKETFILAALPEQPTPPAPSDATALYESGWGRYDARKFDDRATFSSSVTVLGYLQSWRYFEPVAARVRQEFSLTPRMAAVVDSFFRGMGVARDELIIGVHVRRGDMETTPNQYTLAPPEYLKMAIDHYVAKYGRSNRLSFIFATNDRRWVDDFLARHLARNIAVRRISFKAEVDLAILSRCNHSIVTVGTFGWWAAWLAGGDVVYYKDFIRTSSILYRSYDSSDYYPPHWQGMA